MRLTSTISNLSSNHTYTIDSERGTFMKGIVSINVSVKDRKESRTAVIKSVCSNVNTGNTGSLINSHSEQLASF